MLGKEPNARPEKLDPLEEPTDRTKIVASPDAAWRPVDAQFAQGVLPQSAESDPIDPVAAASADTAPVDGCFSARDADFVPMVKFQFTHAPKTAFAGYEPDVPLMGTAPGLSANVDSLDSNAPRLGFAPVSPENMDPLPPAFSGAAGAQLSSADVESLNVLSVAAGEKNPGGAADVAPPGTQGAADVDPRGRVNREPAPKPGEPVPIGGAPATDTKPTISGQAHGIEGQKPEFQPNTQGKVETKPDVKVEPKPAVIVETKMADQSGLDSDAGPSGGASHGFGTKRDVTVEGDPAEPGDAGPTVGAVTGTDARGNAAQAAPTDRAPTISAADRASVVRQIADRVQLLAASRPRDGVTIHLDPKDLGSLTLVVKSYGSEVETRIYAHNDALRAALEQSRPQLTQALESRGLSLGAMMVGQHEAQQHQTGNEGARHSAAASTQGGFGNESGNVVAANDWRSAARSDAGVDLWI